MLQKTHARKQSNHQGFNLKSCTFSRFSHRNFSSRIMWLWITKPKICATFLGSFSLFSSNFCLFSARASWFSKKKKVIFFAKYAAMKSMQLICVLILCYYLRQGWNNSWMVQITWNWQKERKLESSYIKKNVIWLEFRLFELINTLAPCSQDGAFDIDVSMETICYRMRNWYVC